MYVSLLASLVVETSLGRSIPGLEWIDLTGSPGNALVLGDEKSRIQFPAAKESVASQSATSSDVLLLAPQNHDALDTGQKAR